MQIAFGAEEMRPLVRQVVAEVMAELQQHPALADDSRLAYSEPEAADLLGVKSHVLRDERLRGRIDFTKIVGGRVRYTKAQLAEYLARGRG